MDSSGRREEVAIGASRRVWKVILSVLMARKAGVARHAGLVAVAAVALGAGLVLRLRMQAGQPGALVAGGAGRRARHAAWPVRAMATGAALLQLAVRARRFVLVARRAHLAAERARMWLVTRSASLVTFGSAGGLLLVARPAFFLPRARVRLVAGQALLVATTHLRLLALVASRAALHQAFGFVRQAAVAALASLMPRVHAHLLHALGVAARAHRRAPLLQVEGMWLVAFHAIDAGVRRVVGSRKLVAAAAILRRRAGLHRLWMRVVAADARPGFTALGMVGVHRPVAVRAGSVRRALHVVRRVAAGAGVVRDDAPAADYVLLAVAAPAVVCDLAIEVVRPMATGALGVTARKQRRRGDDRLLGGVTAGAAEARSHALGVLVRVTSLANLSRSFARRGMRRVHVVVAVGARRALRLGIIVRAVAGQALLSAVHLDRRNVALLLGMAALAIAGRERVQHWDERPGATTADAAAPASITAAGAAGATAAAPAAEGVSGIHHADLVFVAAAVERENVAAGAIGFGARAELLRGLFARVLDVSLLLVAAGAARGVDLADLVVRHLVTLGARRLVLDDVHAVAGDCARDAPRFLHVDPAPPFAFLWPFRLGASSQKRKQKACDQPDRGSASRPETHAYAS